MHAHLAVHVTNAVFVALTPSARRISLMSASEIAPAELDTIWLLSSASMSSRAVADSRSRFAENTISTVSRLAMSQVVPEKPAPHLDWPPRQVDVHAVVNVTDAVVTRV